MRSELSASSFPPYYSLDRLLFGNSDHLHGDVFHTAPGKKRKHKITTVVGGFVVFIDCIHIITINIYTEHGMT